MPRKTNIQHGLFTFVNCTLHPGCPQTWEEPGEPASIEYEYIYLTADHDQEPISDYLDTKWIEQAELDIIDAQVESAKDAQAESRAEARSMADAH